MSDIPRENSNCFSAHVRLWLESDQGNVNLAQVGADFVIADEDCDVPAGSMVWIGVSVDGHETKLPYLLVEGLSKTNHRSQTVVCEPDGIPF